MVMITLYLRQQKRHRCIEQSFGLCERERVGWFGRMALKHVKYHIWNESPVQVWCMILDTGKTQRDGTGREEGGGFSISQLENTNSPNYLVLVYRLQDVINYSLWIFVFSVWVYQTSIATHNSLLSFVLSSLVSIRWMVNNSDSCWLKSLDSTKQTM